MNFSALLVACLFGTASSISLERAVTVWAPDVMFDESSAEIAAWDAKCKSILVTNASANRIDVWKLNKKLKPTMQASIDLSTFGGGVNSVASDGSGLIAVAVEANIKQEDGQIIFFRCDGEENESDYPLVAQVTAGALPDMVTFTPDGKYVLAANEGEPNDEYTVDPEGSITIIDVENGFQATQVGFTAYNSQKEALMEAGVRIFGPGASVAQDLEPEYIAVSADSTTAYVALQENNAIAVVDIQSAMVTDIYPLGYKDHSLEGNEFDASNRDDGINIQTWPTLGMYQPDAIATFMVGDKTYIATANEGDSRDYDGYSEEVRVDDLGLDPLAFPNAATLQVNENLGRLKTTTSFGETDLDTIYSYGGRSFSIFDEDGELVYDSGSDFETIIAEEFPTLFNTNNDEVPPEDGFDSRSDDKGPEPEAITVGALGDSLYAFIGLERVGGIMVYDVTDPTDPYFIEYVRSEEFEGELGPSGYDLGPEGIVFVDAEASVSGSPLLIVTHEVSGTISVFKINV